MMTKNRTQFVFIIAAGLSLISGFSQTADIEIPDDSSEGKTAKVENSHITTAMAIAKTAAVVAPIAIAAAIVAPIPVVARIAKTAVLGISVQLWLESLVVVAEWHGYRLFEKDWNKEDARERHLSAQKRRRECDRKRQQEFESKFFGYFGGATNKTKAVIDEEVNKQRFH